jgi:hypothetical protein
MKRRTRGSIVRNLLLVAAVMALAAGVAAEEAEAPGEAAGTPRAEVIDEILTKPLDEEEYVEAVRCLSPHSYRNVRVLDDRHVLFEGPGERVWLNRLRNRCIGLRPNATLRFRMRDTRVCELDTFEAVDSFLRGMDRVSATCSLGRFMPVTPEQVEAIRGAVDEGRRR